MFILVFRIKLDTHPYIDNNIEYLKYPGESESNVGEYIKLTNNIAALQNVIDVYNEKIEALRSRKADALVSISNTQNSHYILGKKREQLQVQLDTIKNVISIDEGDAAFSQYQSLLLRIYLWHKIIKDYQESGYEDLAGYHDLLFKMYALEKITKDYQESGYEELGQYQNLLFKIYTWNKIASDLQKSIS